MVSGDRLAAGLQVVGDWYEENARAVHRDDPYAAHVTRERKEMILAEKLAFAADVRAGKSLGFSVWQRLNQHFTGECIAFLPRTGATHGE